MAPASPPEIAPTIGPTSRCENPELSVLAMLKERASLQPLLLNSGHVARTPLTDRLEIVFWFKV